MHFLRMPSEQPKNKKETVILLGVEIRREKTHLEYKIKCHYSAIFLDNLYLIWYITSKVKHCSYELQLYGVGFEVLTPVVMNSVIFWDIKACSPLKTNDVSDEHVTCILLRASR
jgi:hypothetical protein